MNSTHKNHLLRTASGRFFDPRKPDPAVIEIADIATGQSNRCRYLGVLPLNYWYSNAQHGLLCVDAAQIAAKIRPAHIAKEGNGLLGLDPALGLRILLHDATEDYCGCGDIPGPVKHWVELDGVQVADIEDRWMAEAIAPGLGLPSVDPYTAAAVVEICDHAARLIEERDIWGVEPMIDETDPYASFYLEAIDRIEINTLYNPEEAREAFLSRFHQLMQEAQ